MELLGLLIVLAIVIAGKVLTSKHIVSKSDEDWLAEDYRKALVDPEDVRSIWEYDRDR